MNRRTFLLRAGMKGIRLIAIASIFALTGCKTSPSNTLRVRLLKNSIPVQVVSQFRKQQKPVNLDFSPEAQLQDLFVFLEELKERQTNPDSPKKPFFSLPFFKTQPPKTPDLLTLGDYRLEEAILNGLIQPIEPKLMVELNNLPSKWRKLVKRNDRGQFDEKGKAWGVPYSWGTTVIAFRRDRFKSLGWEPTDWSDLWRSQLQGRISLLDHPREVIGLTLKKLGYSYNSKNLEDIPNLEAELHQLHRQTKFYSSDTYLQPLINGDTWVAVGWSSDILPIMQRYNLGAVVPSSGTALWADLWVRPASSSDSNINLASDWINFCWQSDKLGDFSLLRKRASPAIVSAKRDDLSKALRENSILLPDESILEKSEFLLPIPEETSVTLNEYEEMWHRIRQSKLT